MSDAVRIPVIVTEIVRVPTGQPGSPGSSAYDVAVANGFVGTEAEWLASLQGDEGPVGEQGPAGPQGEQGPAGAPGETGPEGPQGPAGADGAPGTPGADGAPGTDGNSVLNGTGAPSGVLGVDGDFYIDTAAEAIYGPKAAGAWGSPTSLIGPAGADGAPGADGEPGADGAPGVGVPAGGTAGQLLKKDSGADFDTSWGDDLATAAGSAMNPHTTQGAARNSSLPKNFWQYTGTEGVDDPTNWLPGDEWISA